MTRLDLQNLTLQYLDDINGGYHTPAIVNGWLNLGQGEVQKLLILAHENFYLKQLQTTMVLNQGDYSMPSDFFILNMLEVVTGGTAPNEVKYNLMPITQNQQYLLASLTNGQPEAYFIRRNNLVVTPVPNAQGQLLRLHYHYKAADMTLDTDVPDVPEQ